MAHVSLMAQLPRKVLALLMVLIFLLTARPVHCSTRQEKSTTTVVLVGATGNLAQKYLWTSLVRLANPSEEGSYAPLTVVAAARADSELGRKQIDDIIEHKVKASDKAKRAFSEDTLLGYHQLKVEAHLFSSHGALAGGGERLSLL